MRTNAEVFDGKDGRPSLVETYFRFKETTLPSYSFKRPQSDSFGNVDGNLKEFSEFAQGPCIECLRFGIGDIVQVTKDAKSQYRGRYATVRRYGIGYYSKLEDVLADIRNGEADDAMNVGISFPGSNEIVKLPFFCLRAPDVPPEMYEFVKARIMSDPDSIRAACPFKDEHKDPVPPCMKGGDDD